MIGRVRRGAKLKLRAALMLAIMPSGPLAAQLHKGDATVPPSTAAYQPQGPDERGLWMEMEEAERELRQSNFVIRDPALNAYVKDVLCRTVGADRCAAARIYIIRTPVMNASMAPNGMMQVYTGLLLRMRDEAQLASVLGHEYAHFERRHSLKGFRDARSKTDWLAWLSIVAPTTTLLAQSAIIGTFFANTREMEREADREGLRYIAAAGYATASAPKVWSQLRAEQDATAAARKRKSKKDRTGGFFATHPNAAERIAYLSSEAANLPQSGDRMGESEYRTALGAWWAPLIDDQIKLNDFGATDFLLSSLAESGGWIPELLYARAELFRQRGGSGDMAMAATLFTQAIAAGSALPEARRGLGLALLRTGATEPGRLALRDYLRMKPDAGDRAMIAMLAGEP